MLYLIFLEHKKFETYSFKFLGVVHISSNGCKGQCLVIVTDVIAKTNSFGIPKSEKLMKLLRNGIKIGRLNFALITAHAKLGIYFRRVGETLIQPKKGTTESTLNIHCFKIMGDPSTTKRMVCRRNIDSTHSSEKNHLSFHTFSHLNNFLLRCDKIKDFMTAFSVLFLLISCRIFSK